MDTNDALELVFLRNEFYRRLHFLALGAFAISLLLISLLIGTIVYIKRHPVHPFYFAADNVSRLLQIIPVNTPNMSTDDVIKWTVKAVTSALTYDYVNYHMQLQGAEKYFTTYGWTQYMTALTASNNLLGVIQQKMVGLAQIVGPPQILAQGILGGAYAWKFKMPVLVTYLQPPYTAANKYSNALTVTVIVQRQTAMQGNMGLGIVQMITEMANLPSSGPAQISNSPT